MKNVERKKLRYLVENILSEEFFKEQDEELAGFGQLTQDPLVKTFIQPFTDVIKTAAAETQKIGATAMKNVSQLAKQTAVLAIPFFAASMIDDIKEASEQKLEQRLNSINARYADVLDRNWQTIRTTDIWGLTFLLNPTVGLGEKALLKAPGASLGVLEVLTAGNEKVAELRQQAQKLGVNVFPPSVAGGGGSLGGAGGMGIGGGGGFGDLGAAMFGGDMGGGGEAVDRSGKQLLEQQAQQKQQKPRKLSNQQKKAFAQKVQQLMKDPAVQQSLQKSPVVAQMRAAGLEAVTDVLKPVMAANSYEQLQKAIGPEFEKFEKQALANLPEEATDEQIDQLKQAMVPELKNAYKQVMVQQLQKVAKQNPSVAEPVQDIIKQIS